jgi:hypothetical protein
LQRTEDHLIQQLHSILVFQYVIQITTSHHEILNIIPVIFQYSPIHYSVWDKNT